MAKQKNNDCTPPPLFLHCLTPSNTCSFLPSCQLGEPLICCTFPAVPIATLGLLLLVFPACTLVFVRLCVCAAVFRKSVKASAVCRFSLSEVQEAFRGPYMESQDSGSEWKEYTGKIPDPRPGTVNTYALMPSFLYTGWNTEITHSLTPEKWPNIKNH